MAAIETPREPEYLVWQITVRSEVKECECRSSQYSAFDYPVPNRGGVRAYALKLEHLGRYVIHTKSRARRCFAFDLPFQLPIKFIDCFVQSFHACFCKTSKLVNEVGQG